MGTVNGERLQRGFERRLGPLGTFAFTNVMGDLWARPQLSRRDRSLIVISTLASLQNKDELFTHTKVALNHGLTRTEIQEAILHVAGYAGFPAAMPASRIIDDVYRDLDGIEAGGKLAMRSGAEHKDDTQRWRDASDVRKTLTGGKANPDPTKDRANLVAALGPVGEMAFDFAFGEVWSRPEMSRRDRSLVVISILTALSKPEELAFHVPAGLNHGLSRVEIEEIMMQMTVYGGIPRAVEGIRAAKEAFAKLDKRKGSRL